MTATFDDRDQIRSAKARYCRFVDTQEWTQFATLMEPDLEVRVIDPAGVTIAAFDDRDSYVDAVIAFLEGARSIHQIHNEEFERISDTRIAAIWSMADKVIFPERQDGRPARMHGYGHYHELWRRGTEGWRLARVELRRTILDFIDP